MLKNLNAEISYGTKNLDGITKQITHTQQPTGAKGETMAKRKTGKVNDQVISNLDLNVGSFKSIDSGFSSRIEAITFL